MCQLRRTYVGEVYKRQSGMIIILLFAGVGLCLSVTADSSLMVPATDVHGQGSTHPPADPAGPSGRGGQGGLPSGIKGVDRVV